MSLQKVTDNLMHDPAVAEKLRLVDAYIAHRNRAGRGFVLPPEHDELEPVIERYATDFPRFVAYVKQLRDEVPARSDAYISIHELYRTLDIRLVQQQRRDRAKRAIEVYERRSPKASVEEKQRWLRKVEQTWGRRRLAVMDAARRKTESGRLSTDEREEILKDFWKEIDDEIEVGDF